MRPVYNYATREELDLIHRYSMKSLEEVGVRFMCGDIIHIFKAHGFRMDGDKVFITEKDVWAALATAPRHLTGMAARGT